MKSINEPDAPSHIALTPQSVNEPRPLPEGPPTVEGLNPAEAPSGTASQLLVVHGANFIEGCVITFDGTPMATNFERADKLNTTLVLSTTPAGEYPVTVTLLSASTAPATFTVTEEAAPEAEGVDPDELEDEIEEAEEEGDFKPVHRGRPTHTLSNKRSKAKR